MPTTEDKFRQEAEAKLPLNFLRACQSEAECVLMHQAAFGYDELWVLGAAIKYAGLSGKEVRVIAS